MLQNMAKEHHWSHNEMLKMSKRIFFRYYGYYYIKLILEDEDYKRRERESKQRDRPRNWKTV